MRTTVNIDDHLLSEAKVVAARSRRSLGQVLDDALRVHLSERTDLGVSAQKVVLPVDGGSGLQPGVDLEDRESLFERLGENERPRAAG